MEFQDWPEAKWSTSRFGLSSLQQVDRIRLPAYAHLEKRCDVHLMFRVCFTVAAISFWSGPALGQSIVVQQPVVQRFGVNTAVSVPDQGSVFLGGVSSAQTFGGSQRPALPSSRQFRSVTHSGASVNVTIHDFAEMDRAILSVAGSQTATHSRSNATGMSAYARESLLKRHAARKRSAPGYAAEGSTIRRLGSRTLP